MRSILTIVLVMLLSGCSAIDLKQYRSNEPALDLFGFFGGQTKGWGIVQDRKGILTRQFIVDINGTVNNDGSLTLVEDFEWSDGKKSNRTWNLVKQDEHRFTGRAEDVIDSANGILYGNVLNWKYMLNLEIEDATWKIKFDDWMFLVSENILINRAIMTKFGFRVGEITIVFQKQINSG